MTTRKGKRRPSARGDRARSATELSFRAPGSGERLRELVRRAWPEASDELIRQTFEAGGVRVGREVTLAVESRVLGGAEIRVSRPVDEFAPDPTPLRVLLQGEDFCVVLKHAGGPGRSGLPMEPDAHALLAAALDRPLEFVRPVHSLDDEVGGAWLIALSEDAATRLSEALAGPEAQTEFRALVPALPWPEGTLQAGLDDRDAQTRFRRIATQNQVDELELVPLTDRRHQLRRHLAGAQAPVLGDPLYGGIMVEGGTRLYCRRIVIGAEGIDVSTDEPEGFRPREAVFPKPKKPPLVTVSAATVTALERGHPWILTDTETSDVGAFRPGTLARVRGAGGEDAGFCRIEGSGRIAGRAWSRPGLPTELDARVGAALTKRAKLLREREARRPTTAFRLIHGEADGFPGLMVDYLDGELRVLTMGRACERVRDALIDELCQKLAAQDAGPEVEPGVVLVQHLTPRPRGELRSVLTLRGEPRRGPFCVHEHGLSFEVDHGLDDPMRSRPGFGLFLDQRANRRRLARHVHEQCERKGRGGRWLNLFCHSGSFSVALLAAGADEVVSVDLSRTYLNTLQRNLEHNGLDAARHEGVKLDAERYLEGLPENERFDGIVLDPPTASASGRRFWSARKSLARLLEKCLPRLRPGGTLLACRNDHGARESLSAMVSQAAAAQRVRLHPVKEAPPGPDFPRLPGFREGDAFEGVLAVRKRS